MINSITDFQLLKLDYLEKGSGSNISYNVHQYDFFTTRPKKKHGGAFRILGKIPTLHKRQRYTNQSQEGK